MAKRKEWTQFFCTEEIDQALRECDEKRSEEIRQAYLATRKQEAGKWNQNTN